MSESYKYIYTHFSTFGTIPTYKVFIDDVSGRVKFIFADNTFVYGLISDWGLKHSGLNTRKAIWSDEPKSFLESEKKRLIKYKLSHPEFVAECNLSNHID